MYYMYVFSTVCVVTHIYAHLEQVFFFHSSNMHFLVNTQQVHTKTPCSLWLQGAYNKVSIYLQLLQLQNYNVYL